MNINTNEFITGGVARYTIDCPLCKKGQIIINNHLMLNDGFAGDVLGVSAMVNHPNKQLTFISTAWEIYTIAPNN